MVADEEGPAPHGRVAIWRGRIDAAEGLKGRLVLLVAPLE